jgi:hypothetical protein
MLKEKYKPAMDNIIPSAELISETKELDKMKPKSSGIVWKFAVSFATAMVVICLYIFGLPNLNISPVPETNPSMVASNNSFALTAYAAEQQNDGIIVKGQRLNLTEDQFSILEFPDDVSGKIGESIIYSDNGEVAGITVFTGLGIQIDGKNIISAKLLADKGHFGVIRTDDETYWYTERLDEVIINDIGSVQLFLWEMDFMGTDLWEDPIRSQQIGSAEPATESEGSPQLADDISKVSPPYGERVRLEKVTITAVVTFEDGDVQEKSIIFDPQSILEDYLSRPPQPMEPDSDGTVG